MLVKKMIPVFVIVTGIILQIVYWLTDVIVLGLLGYIIFSVGVILNLRAGIDKKTENEKSKKTD